MSTNPGEAHVLFELISTRYERGSLLITANQPFGEWGKVFPDPAMTIAVVDRLVHYATIFEIYGEATAAAPSSNASAAPEGHPSARQLRPMPD
jgi:DNA replication protein DnaC